MPAIRKRLTDEIVADLPIKRKRYIVYDTQVSGLGVRVGRARKTWVLVARIKDHTSRKSIGAVGKITVEQARQRAQRVHTQLQGEVDTTLTFKEVAEKFYQHIERLKRWDEVVRTIERECKPWMSRSIASITKKDVIAALDRKRSTPSAAHHLLADLRRLFNYAIARDILETSPCDRINAQQLLGGKKIRTRVLTDDEIRAVWRGAESLSAEFRDAIHLLILTGCRKGEVSEARRNEFKVMSKRWVLSGDRTKQAAQHVVPMSKAVLEIVVQRMTATEAEDDDYLFGRPLKGWSKVKRRLDKATGKIDHWTLHDLRRTFRTRLSSLRVPEHVAELAIGHAKKSLQRVYDQHAYATELREAFDAWARELEHILRAEPEGSKLVSQPATTERRSYPALAHDMPASGG